MRYKKMLFVLIIAVTSQVAVAQENEPATEDSTKAKSNETETGNTTNQEKLLADFGSLLKESALIGTFTVDGDDRSKARPERYEISKVVKQAEGDFWIFFARIKYSEHDVKVPIPVEVKWAGNTPVITVDNLTIPTMGTFDARVVISDNKYAGTWRHGKVGGLMYGHIEKQKDEKDENVEKPVNPN